MSLQRLRRSAAQRSKAPTQQMDKQRKGRGNRPPMRRVKSTRRSRIRDLLRHIPTFAIRFLRLMAFVAFLLPAFVVFVWHYVTCDRIAVYYGDRRCCMDEENDESDSSDSEKDSIGSGSCGKMDACNVVTNGESIHNRKDPFFSRHYLDIYGSRTPLPNKVSADMDANPRKPVVVFLTGGAWIIGYRMWGTLLGRALAPFGVLCIVPDYRNFPRVNIEGMVQDVDMSIQWVMDHVEEYGGDKEKVVLVGQSAGAHIGGVVVAMKVWDWLRKDRRAKESIMNCKGPIVVDKMQNELGVDASLLKSTYSPQQLCGFISTSSPDNLVTMRPVFNHHGLSARVQKSIFGGIGDDQQSFGEEEDVFEKWSPFHMIIKCHMEYVQLLELNDEKSSDERIELKDIFPRFCVIHGTADNTVPISEAREFISLLSKLQIPTETKLYEGWSHTDPILEAPMCGDHSYHRDIYELVCLWTGGNSTSYSNENKSGQNHQAGLFDEKHPMVQPICPSVLVEAARFCNPF